MIRGGISNIIIGAPGEGKSTLTKQLIADVHSSRLFVYDVNAEYFDDEELPELDDFLTACLLKKESVIIFEEATAFFDARRNDKKMIRLLIGKRHTHNIYILIFHDIRSVPYYIYNKCNYVYLFRTVDEKKDVKHPRLLEAFKTVNYEPDKARQLKLLNGNFSPYEIVDLNKRI